MTVPQVRLASMDFTHIEYLSGNESGNGNMAGAVAIDSEDDLKNLSDLGFPII